MDEAFLVDRQNQSQVATNQGENRQQLSCSAGPANFVYSSGLTRAFEL